MSEKASETSEKLEAPIEIIAHGDGWRDVSYIRADVYESDLAERDDMLAVAKELVVVLSNMVDKFSIFRPGATGDA